MHFFDYTGALLSLTSTILYTRESIYAWVVSLAAILVNLYLYYNSGIYADAGLEVIYLGLAGYGLWHWLYGGENKTPLGVTNIPSSELIGCSLLGLIGYCYVYYLLSRHTTSDIAGLDAIATVLSLCGQWFMCRKYIETWIIWLLVDSILIVLFFYKNLPAHMLLNLIYLPIAFYGYHKWAKVKLSAYEYFDLDNSQP